MTLYPETTTLETEPTTHTHRPAPTPSPNGDSPSSGGIQLSELQSPPCPELVEGSDPDTWQPIRTYLGTKWIPTIAGRRNRTCLDCPVYDECAIDVARGDFAWCEDMIPADYQLTNSEHTAYAHAQQGTSNLKHETLR